jgi:putative NADH-flavin reductase
VGSLITAGYTSAMHISEATGPRRLCVIGAAGRTGRELVRLAHREGHRVTALVRDPARLAEDVDRIVVGDGRRTDDVRRAVGGCDAVVSVVAGPDLRPQTVATDVARAVVEAMRAESVGRLVITSSHALVATRPRLWVALARWRFRHPYADLRRAEEVVRTSELSWTVVRANMLTDQPARGRVHVEVGDRDFTGGDWRLTRADFAAVLLEEATSDGHRCAAIEVTGPDRRST